MRIRNENLRTGSLLTHFNPKNRKINQSLLFLVSGAKDIQPLSDIERICRQCIHQMGLVEFQWYSVPDQRNLTSADPLIDISRITRIEACEFAHTSPANLERLLLPVIEKFSNHDPEIFPSAGGAVGSPAEGIQFLDREDDLKALVNLVAGKKNVLLVAPRRTGKTSLMLKLKNRLARERNPQFINLERWPSPEYVAAGFRMLTTGEGFRAALLSIQERKSWPESLQAALEALKKQSQKPLLLLIDELVHLCQNIRGSLRDEEARKEILELLGLLSQAIANGFQMVIAGSMDLKFFLTEEAGIQDGDLPRLLQRFERLNLKPIQPDTSNFEMRRILLGTGLVPEAEDLEWLDRELDLAIPYPALNFLDLLSSKVRAKGSLNQGQLEEELHHFVSNTDAFREFDAHLQRIGRTKPRATTAVTEALHLISSSPFNEGTPVEAVRSRLEKILPDKPDGLLQWLEETFPIQTRNGKLLFVSRMFHRWWRHQMDRGGN